MVDAMAATTRALCEQIAGVVCGYTQSDEITLVLSDFSGERTQSFFDGQVQKICSVAAAIATVTFAREFPDRAPATFDARVFCLPTRFEVANNLLWRQADARRNAITMLCQDQFSARELHGVPTRTRREMLTERGVDLDAVDVRFLHGQLCRQQQTSRVVSYTGRDGQLHQTPGPVTRRFWEVTVAPTLDAQPAGVVLSELLGPDPA